MTVIAFRPRSKPPSEGVADVPVPLTGTFRSPRGRLGHMEGSLRVRRMVIDLRGTFVTGVFTGELHDDDGSLVGVGTRRATIRAELVRHGDGYLPVLRPFQLDLMGITVDVDETTIDPPRPPPHDQDLRRGSRTGRPKGPAGVPS